MAIRCANQPLEHLKLHKIIAIFSAPRWTPSKSHDPRDAWPPSDSVFLPMKVNRMSDTYPPVASEVKPFAQHSNACQNVRPPTRAHFASNDFCVRHIQPKFFRQQQTVIPIINALPRSSRRIGPPDFANRNLMMCVVGVIPFGMHQPLPILSKALSSPAPASKSRCESHFLSNHAQRDICFISR